MTAAPLHPRARRRLLVDGIVQGVGFRPFVYNLARAESLVGFVTNTSDGVVIEIQGPAEALDRFAARLTAEAPPLADIVAVDGKDTPVEASAREFEIRASIDAPGTRTLIPFDVATCADCLAEIRDPEDRRNGYPFTNCTNCGPRWTIIDRIPYDRPHTSMAPFTMCPECQAEYDDPGDRRFHAQPNACPVCGPRVWLEDDDGVVPGRTDPLEAAAGLLAVGRILAHAYPPTGSPDSRAERSMTVSPFGGSFEFALTTPAPARWSPEVRNSAGFRAPEVKRSSSRTTGSFVATMRNGAPEGGPTSDKARVAVATILLSRWSSIVPWVGVASGFHTAAKWCGRPA